MTPTGAEQQGNFTGNPGDSQAALQMALQIVGRLTPEQRAALLGVLGATAPAVQ